MEQADARGIRIGTRPVAAAESSSDPLDEVPARLGLQPCLHPWAHWQGHINERHCDQSRSHDPGRDRDNGQGSLPAGNRGRALRPHSTYPIEGRQTGSGYMKGTGARRDATYERKARVNAHGSS